MRYIIFGFIITLLVACTGPAEQTPPALSSTQTVLKTKPVSTPIIIATTSPVTPTKVTLPSYNLPTWMGDPDISILVVLITDDIKETRTLAFYNAATGEKYEVAMPDDVSAYFWYDNSHFGLLAKDLQSAQKLDLKTGFVTNEPVLPQAFRVWNQEGEFDYMHQKSGNMATALKLLPGNPLGNEMLFQWTRGDTTSKYKAFAADWRIEQRDLITITDMRSKQAIWEIKLPTGFYGTEFAWSPTDENLLAFIQGKPIPNNDIEMASMKLTIVDVVSKKTLGVYDGDFGRMAWSPDGKKILYQNNASRYSNYGVGFRDAPCILFIEADIKRCLRNIPNAVPPGFILTTTAAYEWGTDNETIFYISLYVSQQSQDKMSGNLCIYSLKDGHINCPTQNLAELFENSIVHYELSPNQQYIHFCISASSVLNDYAGTSSDGIINVDGTGFFSWIGAIIDGGPQSCSYGSLWRPLPK